MYNILIIKIMNKICTLNKFGHNTNCPYCGMHKQCIKYNIFKKISYV